VIDAVCDPNVPPLPPHISTDQARSLMKALRKGDPESRGVITQSFKEKILEFLPGR
jgi:pyruvate dehydrogenase (quinone)